MSYGTVLGIRTSEEVFWCVDPILLKQKFKVLDIYHDDLGLLDQGYYHDHIMAKQHKFLAAVGENYK